MSCKNFQLAKLKDIPANKKIIQEKYKWEKQNKFKNAFPQTRRESWRI